MISDFAATIRFEHSHAARGEYFVWRDDRAPRGSTSHRQNMRMLQQKQRVWLLVRQNRALATFLDFEPRAVFNSPQSFNFQSSPIRHCQSRIAIVSAPQFKSRPEELCIVF